MGRLNFFFNLPFIQNLYHGQNVCVVQSVYRLWLWCVFYLFQQLYSIPKDLDLFCNICHQSHIFSFKHIHTYTYMFIIPKPHVLNKHSQTWNSRCLLGHGILKFGNDCLSVFYRKVQKNYKHILWTVRETACYGEISEENDYTALSLQEVHSNLVEDHIRFHSSLPRNKDLRLPLAHTGYLTSIIKSFPPTELSLRRSMNSLT